MESRSPAGKEESDLSGQVILVTGANSGLGRATSLQLARMGATLIMMARDRGRGEEARDEVAAASANSDVHLMLCDLSSLDAVSRLADDFRSRFHRLDVLINNAATYLLRRRESADGFEKMFAVNHLGPYLLTRRLLDVLKRSAPARIVNVASVSHKGKSIDLSVLDQGARFSFDRIYGETKLMNILFTYELARRLEGTDVTANALHPGFVRTNMAQRENGWLVRLFAPLAFVFGDSPEKGAETPVYLAASPDVNGVTGRYFYKKRAIRSSNLSYDEDLQRGLWEVSERLVGYWLEKA